MLEEVENLVFGGGPGAPRAGGGGSSDFLQRTARKAPLVGHDEDRLRQVERGEGRVERDADDGVGQHQLLVLEAGLLRPEEETEARASDCPASRNAVDRRARRELGLQQFPAASPW